jgi:hypothetical protein
VPNAEIQDYGQNLPEMKMIPYNWLRITSVNIYAKFMVQEMVQEILSFNGAFKYKVYVNI